MRSSWSRAALSALMRARLCSAIVCGLDKLPFFTMLFLIVCSLPTVKALSKETTLNLGLTTGLAQTRVLV